jgi:hypothetical protein
MFEFYLELPAWVRALAALVVIGVGVVLIIAGAEGRPQPDQIVRMDGTVINVPQSMPKTGTQANLFKFGIAVSVLGGVLLLTAGKTKKDGDGYNF